jgi:hypothetical protein
MTQSLEGFHLNCYTSQHERMLSSTFVSTRDAAGVPIIHGLLSSTQDAEYKTVAQGCEARTYTPITRSLLSPGHLLLTMSSSQPHELLRQQRGRLFEAQEELQGC